MSKISQHTFQHLWEILTRKKLVLIYKWMVLIVAVAFLVFKLAIFRNYSELFRYITHISFIQMALLEFVILLLPVNILLESYKWKLLVVHSEKLSLMDSVKSVLAGFATGFVTPNRTGEPVGRIIFMKKENRSAGIAYALVNSLTQNIIMAVLGIPSGIFFFFSIYKNGIGKINIYFVVLGLLLILFLAIYFLLPKFSKLSFVQNLSWLPNGIMDFHFLELTRILFVSMARYLVFSFQFYLMLKFFNVDLALWQAIIAIPCTYLFVTFTPSLAFSEPAIRASYAVLFIGAFSSNIAGIAFAGIFIWLINYGIAMLSGNFFILKHKQN